MLRAKPIKHTDVRNQDKFYLVILNDKDREQVINIGRRTYEALLNLQMEDDATKLDNENDPG